jgi:hypothetical protein
MTRKSIPLLLIAILVAVICFADMTIYFKDGTERRVSKITFKGQDALLYLPNGQVVTVSVSSIDLAASGIGQPVGTYGETKLSGKSATTGGPVSPGVSESARQTELRSQWQNADRVAIALTNFDRFHQGEEVHILDRSTARTPQPADDFFQYAQPQPAQVLDQAYVVIYKNPDGTYGKRIIDAVLFVSKFKIREPAIPIAKPATPAGSGAQTTSGQTQTALAKEPSVEPVYTKESDLDRALHAPVPSQPVANSSPLLTMLWVVLGLAGLACIALMILAAKKRRKPFLDTSKFHEYEEELRDFEIEIWLKNGKTMDQLMDICLKKFYQDPPSALPLAASVLKGGSRDALIHAIAKQTDGGMRDAEAVYTEMSARIRWIQGVIQAISYRTGIKPGKAVFSTPIPPPRASAPPEPPPPAVATIASPAQAPIWENVVDLDIGSEGEESLPSQLQNLHKQLGSLG